MSLPTRRIGFAVAGTVGLILAAVLVTAGVTAQARTWSSPVTDQHLAQINHALQGSGIRSGRAVVDRQRRVELQGEFQNEREVDRAFSLAQTVVGARWVSPVTPQNIKVKEWEECLSRLLSGESCGPGGAHVAGQAESAPRPGGGVPVPGGTAPPPPGGAPPAAVAQSGEIPPGPVANKYALIVGVGRFRTGITPLQYANKDAYDVYSYLTDPAGGNFKRENVILLRDEHAVRRSVVRALNEIQRVAREDDLVVVYLSSHGTPPDKFGGVHVVTHDSEVTPRERVWDTSLNEGILREFVQGVRAKRLIVVMDACYSNGAYAQIAGFLPPGGKSLDAGADEGYGRSPRYMAERLLGAKDLRLEDSPRGPSAPTTTAASGGWGKVLVSASGAAERSWESDELRNSVFTRYFIDGLRTRGGAVKDAFEYAKPLVRHQVKREKGAELEQNPQITPSRRDWNMSLAVPGR